MIEIRSDSQWNGICRLCREKSSPSPHSSFLSLGYNRAINERVWETIVCLLLIIRLPARGEQNRRQFLFGESVGSTRQIWGYYKESVNTKLSGTCEWCCRFVALLPCNLIPWIIWMMMTMSFVVVWQSFNNKRVSNVCDTTEKEFYF